MFSDKMKSAEKEFLFSSSADSFFPLDFSPINKETANLYTIQKGHSKVR